MEHPNPSRRIAHSHLATYVTWSEAYHLFLSITISATGEIWQEIDAKVHEHFLATSLDLPRALADVQLSTEGNLFQLDWMLVHARRHNDEYIFKLDTKLQAPGYNFKDLKKFMKSI